MRRLSVKLTVSLIFLIIMIIGGTRVSAFSNNEIINSDDPPLPPPRTSLGYPLRHDEIIPTIATPGETGDQPIIFPYDCYRDPNPNCYARLVYQDFADRNWDIYLTDSLRSCSVSGDKMTAHRASDITPNLRVLGDRIAFASDRYNTYDIYVMYVNDDRKIKRLTFNRADNLYPVWSPDGKTIVYISEEDGIGHLYSMKADGTNKKQLTNTGRYNFSPTWSPDGSQIAWVRATSDVYAKIMVMKSDGSGVRTLTDPLLYLENIKWSPDGNTIAFDYDVNGDGWTDLGLFDIKSKSTSLKLPGEKLYDRRMGTWTPNGKSLYYNSVHYIKFNKQWYIDKSILQEIDFSTSKKFTFTERGFLFYPHVARTDITAPSSQVEPLPTFTTSPDFLVSWSGSDDHEIRKYIVQNRENLDGKWKEWITVSVDEPHQKIFSGKPGITYYFRSSAIDGAGNTEHWPEIPDAFTTVGSGWIHGSITDNRGKPLPFVDLYFLPNSIPKINKTDAFGEYRTLIVADFTQNIDVSYPGFVKVQSTIYDLKPDIQMDYYLAPNGNLVENGDFEDPIDFTSGWTYLGELPIASINGHSGENAARIGIEYIDEWLSDPEIFTNAYLGWSGIEIDQNGLVYVLIYDGELERVTFLYRDELGQWSSSEIVQELDLSPPIYSNILIDQNNILHVILVGERMNYLFRNTDGTWSNLQSLGSGENPVLAADKDNNIFLAYLWNGKICIKGMLQGQTWEDYKKIAMTNLIDKFDFAVDSTGTLNFAWSTFFPDDVHYYALSPSGQTTSQESLLTGVSNPKISLDSKDRVYIFGNTSTHERFIYKKLSGAWSDMYNFSLNIQTADMVVDYDGGVHIVTLPRSSYQVNDYSYLFKPSNGSQFISYTIPIEVDINSRRIAIDVDKNNNPHILTGEAYQTTALTGKENHGAISQLITIPESMEHPTLAFMYAITRNYQTDTSYMNVSIQDDSKKTILFSKSPSTDWTHGWVDLEPWSGKTITVTFALHQTDNRLFTRLLLDQITLCSWENPSRIIHLPLIRK